MMQSQGSNQECWDILILGAGISGLSARRALLDAGLKVLTLEKSRGLGGRMSSRRFSEDWGGGIADLGAQFFSVRGNDFRMLLEKAPKGLISAISVESDSTHTRFIHRGGMNQVARLLLGESLEEDLAPIRRSTRAVRLSRERDEGADGYWKIECEGGEVFRAFAVILTAPLPQSIELLKQSGAVQALSDFQSLRETQYHPCLAAVYPLEFDSGLEPFGIIRNVSPRISGLFDQGKKGIQSGANFLVLHTTPETSRELWDDAADEVLSELWAEALDALPRIYKKGPARALPVNSILHKWRYCEPVQPLSIPYASSGSSLFLAGDAFIGARVEGAFESGRQAAHALIRERQRR